MFPLSAKPFLQRQRHMRDRYASLARPATARADILSKIRQPHPASGYQAQSGARNYAIIWSNPNPDPHNRLPHLRPVNIKEAILDRRDTPAPQAKDYTPEIAKPLPDNKSTPAPSGKGGKGSKATAASSFDPPPPPPGQKNGPGRPTAGNGLTIGGRRPEPD